MKKLFTILLTLITIGSTGQINYQIRFNLYRVAPTGEKVLMDGVLSNYKSDACNCIDDFDAPKLTNPGINVAILRDGFRLAVERRDTVKTFDSTFIQISNIPAAQYCISIVQVNVLDDKIISIKSNDYGFNFIAPANTDTTWYQFQVVQSGIISFNMNIERISSAVPVILRSFTVIRLSDRLRFQILVDETQLSYNDRIYLEQVKPSYQNIITVYNGAMMLNTVNIPLPQPGQYQYRLRIMDESGKASYSDIVTVFISKAMSLYPNPATNYFNLDAGKATVVSMNGSSQNIVSLAGRFDVSNLMPGAYIVKANGETFKLVKQ